MRSIKALGIDLAKNVFELKGFDQANQVVYRKRVRRHVFLKTVVRCDAEIVYMEACGGAHHWARTLTALGIHVELLPPHRVKAFCRGNKNDSNDAEAILLAGAQPSVRRVAIKTLEQQDIQSLHRVREQVKQQMLALSNHYATLGDANKFKSGREVSAWLGLVSRQHASGERQHLGGITKRGDRYLRMLLIHGARAMVWHADKMKGAKGEWLRRCIARIGPHKATVALANKNARIMWALLAHNDEYRVMGTAS